MRQLCQLASAWPGRSVPVMAATQEKLDGWRALYLRDHEGQPGLYTRNGMPIEGVSHILHELAAYERHAGAEMFFDGEFVIDRGGDTLAATKQWCESGWKQGGSAGTFHLFDGFALDDWRRGGCDMPWHERQRRLSALRDAVEADEAHQWTWAPGSRGNSAESVPVSLVNHRQIFTSQCAIDHAREVWQRGGEGVVIKDMAAPYLRHRCSAWQKVGRPWQDKLGWKEAA